MDKESSGVIMIIQVSYYLTETSMLWLLRLSWLLILLLAILNIVIMVINELNEKIAAVKSVGVIMVHHYYTWLKVIMVIIRFY